MDFDSTTSPQASPAIIRRLVIGLFILNLLVIALAILSLADKKSGHEQRARLAAENLSLTLDRSIEGSFDKIGLALEFLGDDLDQLLAQGASDPVRVRKILSQFSGSLPMVAGLHLADSGGRVLFATASSAAVPPDVSDSDYFLSLRGKDKPELAISRPVVDAGTGEYFLVLARALHGQDGRFGGLLGASVSIRHFGQLFASLKLGSHGSIGLRDGKLGLICRFPELTTGKGAVGSKMVADDFTAAVQNDADRGFYVAGSTSIDGIQRLHSYRRNPQYHYYINVGIAQEEFLKDWWLDVRNTAGFVGIFLAASILFSLKLGHDFKELRNTESALRDSEEKFRTIFESAAEGILLADIEGKKFFTGNRVIQNMLGYSLEELKRLWVSDIHPAEDLPHVLEQFEKQTRKEIETAPDLPMKRKDGSVMYADITSRPVILNGKTYLAGFFRDVTERKRNEDDRRKLEQQIQQNQKLDSLGLMAGGIAHDFNNLLSGVFGYIEFAQLTTRDKKCGDYLAKATAAIDRAKGLTLQLLTFSKGGSPITQRVVLPPFIQETVKFALSGSNVSGRYVLPEDLWACKIDKNQIAQAIDNLIINACQAMPLGGTIEISARNITLTEKEPPFLEKGKYVKLAIKDSGVGMPKEIIPRIFDPFFTTKAKGHGLGLATCYSIIKRHGGGIEVESEPGKGTTFFLFLPATTEADIVEDPRLDIRHTGTGSILLVDDEDAILEATGGFLRDFGYRVITAKCGQDALAILKESGENHSFVAMVLDLTIPGGMGGKEAAEVIRGDHPHLPLFVSSGYAEDPVMAYPRNYGFNASISKPYRRSDLAAMLEKHLKRH